MNLPVCLTPLKRAPKGPSLAYFFFLLSLALIPIGCGKLRSIFEKPVARPHFAVLSWDASVSPVTGYNVYRAEAPGSSYVKITSEPVAATLYTDLTVEAGKTYTYYLTAVNSQKKESKPSESIAVTVPSP